MLSHRFNHGFKKLVIGHDKGVLVAKTCVGQSHSWRSSAAMDDALTPCIVSIRSFRFAL